jgi:hypothetical protein
MKTAISRLATVATGADKWLKKNWPGYGVPEFVEYSRQVHLAGQAILNDSGMSMPGPTGREPVPLKDLFAMAGEENSRALVASVHAAWLAGCPAHHSAAPMMIALCRMIVEGAPDHARASAEKMAAWIRTYIEAHVMRMRPEGIWFGPFPPEAKV